MGPISVEERGGGRERGRDREGGKEGGAGTIMLVNAIMLIVLECNLVSV